MIKTYYFCFFIFQFHLKPIQRFFANIVLSLLFFPRWRLVVFRAPGYPPKTSQHFLRTEILECFFLKRSGLLFYVVDFLDRALLLPLIFFFYVERCSVYAPWTWYSCKSKKCINCTELVVFQRRCKKENLNKKGSLLCWFDSTSRV